MTAAARSGPSKQETAERAYRELRFTIAFRRAELAKLEASAQPLIDTLVTECGVRTIEIGEGEFISFRRNPMHPTLWVQAPRPVLVKK